MRLLITTTFVACALFLNAQIENGCISIDFETFPNESPSSGLILSDQFKDAFGLSFRLEGGGFPVLAQVGGNNAEAFGSAWGNDTPAPGVDIGQFFLTDDGQLSGLTSPPIILDFEIPIDSFAGCILDMDFEEFFIIQALDASGTVILEERIDAGDPGTGDGALTCWGFNLPGCEGSIYSIRYAGFRPASSPGAFGLGMDYFSFCYSGLQIDTETTPVTCDELGSINIFSTANEVYEYSIDGINYSINGFFDQLNQGVQVIYVRDGDNCTTSVDVNIELDTEDLPDPIFVDEEICEGQIFSYNDQQYSTTGTYQQTLITANGCDTLWNLTLTVFPNSSEIINTEICEGETFVLNGQSYSMGGTFEQELNTVEGCDSIIEINLILNPNTEENISAQICEGESYNLNGETYAISGFYSQQITNNFGCDSLLNLDLEVLGLTAETFSTQFCEGQSFELNDQIYTLEGSYIQMLTNEAGCDSTLTLELEFATPSTEALFEEICEGDDITINGILYSTAGSYSQVLVNSEGCDSLLDIKIDFLPVAETCENISIFEGEVFNLNGQTYSAEGTYQQLLQTTDGCDSLVIIKLKVLPKPSTLVHYDLNDCAAGGSSYNEFIPQYEEELQCAEIIASILNRPSGLTHSCTPGAIGSGMCISSEPSCMYQEDSEHRMIFEVFISPTTGPVSIAELRFFEKAPERYQFIAGGTGLNNYPTLYSLKVFKDNNEIYSSQSISTNREWTQQSFNFRDLDQFVFSDPGNLTIEFLAYCPIGIPSNVAAWDIDELSLFGFCQPDNNKVIGNVMTTKVQPLSQVEIGVRDADLWEYYTSDSNGDFAFDTDYDQTSVVIKPNKNDDPLNGVSTLDLIHIQRHVLGLESFDAFTELVAADINKDDKIDVMDLLELRKLLLGIYENFPQNTSWRFLDAHKKYTLLSDIDDQMTIRTLGEEINLEGIKVGDVNQSYILSATKTELEPRSQSSFKLIVKESRNNDGELLVGFFASEDFHLSGFQATFNVGDYSEFRLVPHKLPIAKQNFHINNDALKITWSSQNQEIKKDELLFEIVFEEYQEVGNIYLDSSTKNEIYQASDLSVYSLALENEINHQNNDDAVQLNILPNPFRNVTKVQIVSKERLATKYELIDATGKLIKSKSILLEPGVNEIDLNRTELPGAGIYFIMIHRNQSVFIKRIVLL